MLKLLKPGTTENVRGDTEEDVENETRSFYTPTKTVRTNSTQNNDINVGRNSDLILTFYLDVCITGRRHFKFTGF